MKELVKAFNGKQVRVIIQNGVEWFVAKDVCEILGIVNHKDAIQSLRERLDRSGVDSKGVATTYPLKTGGGEQEMLCVNEQGLYELIFSSRKEEAVRFRAWVTGEVLPSIRKTGKYDVRDIKKKSVEWRNLVTDQWKRQGVEKPAEYAALTVEEYKQLFDDKSLRKKEMDRSQMLKLSAFEAVEAWKLSECPENVLGFTGCKVSIGETACLLEEVKRLPV